MLIMSDASLPFLVCLCGMQKGEYHVVEITNTMHRFAPLLYILAATCFGSSLPLSGSFWIRLSYMKIQIDLVVYLKYIKDENWCVKHVV
jgi:hypothetical protein